LRGKERKNNAPFEVCPRGKTKKKGTNGTQKTGGLTAKLQKVGGRISAAVV